VRTSARRELSSLTALGTDVSEQRERFRTVQRGGNGAGGGKEQFIRCNRLLSNLVYV
jgi:hypothetical protein